MKLSFCKAGGQSKPQCGRGEEVQRGGYWLIGRNSPASFEDPHPLCPVNSSGPGHAIAYYQCCRGRSMSGEELDLLASKVISNAEHS